MKRILLSLSAAMISAMAMAQEPGIVAEPSEQPSEENTVTANSVKMPYMELADGGLNWEDLEPGKFYDISAPAHWYEHQQTEDSADGQEPEKGWIMEMNPQITEYISINEYTDMLTWITMEEIMLEEVTDSTAARATRKKAIESVHTADISGEYLDIVGTISGIRQKSRNFQIMQYAGKLIIYDYNNKILRLIGTEPRDRNTIIDEQN